jgi:hypothetical protein
MSIEDFQHELYDYIDLVFDFYIGQTIFVPVNKLQKWFFRNVESVYKELDKRIKLYQDENPNENITYQITENGIIFSYFDNKTNLVEKFLLYKDNNELKLKKIVNDK